LEGFRLIPKYYWGVPREWELAGDGTSYETQIAKNSADIRALEQDIYRIDIELELLKLYSKVADAYR